MGDRANVHIQDSDRDPGVYLYTHWQGSQLPVTLQRALQKRWRWHDAPYLTRIIFCEMVEGNEANETGFGISTIPCDGQDRILRVNVQDQTVTVVDEDIRGASTVKKRWTFEEYCKARPSWGRRLTHNRQGG